MDTNEENNNIMYYAIVVKCVMLLVAFLIPNSLKIFNYDEISYDDINYI